MTTPDLEQPPLVEAWYLSGPTASGKSGVALALAERLGAEILSLDSMALYRGMDIGTAKPAAAERAHVPHHLLDLVNPDQDFSLAEYLAAAHAAAAEIRSRGKIPLFVGGTPLYLKSLLRGVYPGPPADWEFRRQIEDELQTVGIEALHERLLAIDPLAASKLHPHDKRRIIRALEVFRAVGQPLSHRQVQFDESLPAVRCRVFVLQRARQELHQRINARVEQMFAAGLVEEVRGLVTTFGRLGRTAAQAVGYREVLDLFQEAQPDLNGCIERVKARTRQFARRQETWFRSLPECTFIPQAGEASPTETAEEILKLDRERQPV